MKEHQHVDNIIPLLVQHHGMRVQDAVDTAKQMIVSCYQDFEALTHVLLTLGQEHNIAGEIHIFLQSCTDFAIGIASWA